MHEFMLEKIKTLKWFAARPSYWAHAVALMLRKLSPNRDAPLLREQATEWAAARAVTVAQSLCDIGLLTEPDRAKYPYMQKPLLDEAKALAGAAQVKMGGPGDLELLHAAAALSGSRRIVETGVAYGWSSLAILAAIENREGATLVSVDMPYPKCNNEPFVGVVVPERFRGAWVIVREPDRRGLGKAIARLGGNVDLCHYDSDKSWAGRRYGYPIMWRALVPGGVFISDDIQDNFAFRDFVAVLNLPFAVTESQGKYVGILRKPV